MRRVEQTTYDLLLEIGLPFKRVSRYDWVDQVGTAVWTGKSEDAGFIKLYLGCEVGAVAHEIGHGFHEALNHNMVAVLPFPVRWPEDGEAVAEAIRYFVEQRLESSWQPAQDKQTLEFCGYDFNAFRTLVRSLAKDP